MEFTLASNPTLVVSSPRYLDESILGYVLRLTDCNGYSSANTIKKLLSQITGSPLKMKASIAADAEVLAAIAKLADSDASLLLKEKWNTLNSAVGRYFNIHGESLPLDAVMDEQAQVCSQCLLEYGYIREAWELSGVTVCTIHSTVLIDTCPHCNQRLSSVRVPLSTCSKCRGDLRFVSTETGMAEEVQLAEYFAAIAPFRIKIADTITVDYTESLFGIAQICSFHTMDILWERWDEKQFARLPIARRRDALRHITSAMDGGVIDAEKIHGALASHVAHRVPYLQLDAAMMPLRKFVMESAFLSPETRRALSFGTAELHQPTAAERYNLRPPQLSTAEQVKEFLCCSHQEWLWLLKKKYLTVPIDEHNFDADQVLAAQARLALFCSIDEMDCRFGVPGLTEKMIEWHVLRLPDGYWNSLVHVDMLDVGKVLDQLLSQSMVCMSEKDKSFIHFTRISETQPGRTDLAEAYANIFARVLAADFFCIDWRPPYMLNDIWISDKDACLLFKNKYD